MITKSIKQFKFKWHWKIKVLIPKSHLKKINNDFGREKVLKSSQGKNLKNSEHVHKQISTWLCLGKAAVTNITSYRSSRNKVQNKIFWNQFPPQMEQQSLKTKYIIVQYWCSHQHEIKHTELVLKAMHVTAIRKLMVNFASFPGLENISNCQMMWCSQMNKRRTVSDNTP